MDFMIICFDALNTYGKTPDQIGNIVKLFIISLAEYPPPLIRSAFERWIKTKSGMPTPAEIITLIEENNLKLLDYLERVRETGGGLTQTGYDFIETQLGKDWRKYV